MTGAHLAGAEAPRAGDPAGLGRVRIAARLLDEAVRVPYTDRRVGLDALLGLLPIGGDAVGALLSLYLVVEGYRLRVRRGVLARMVGNVLLDFVLGLTPVVGDAVDAAWNANRRNLALVEEHHRPLPQTDAAS